MSTKSHNKKLLNNNNARNRNNKLEKELEIYGDGFAPPHHHSAPLSVDYRPSLIRFLELKTRCFVLLLQLCGIWILVMLANWAGAAVASCSSSNSSSSGLSEMTERKRARLLNKQNKMLAEYRLVAASAAARDCGPASKKIKLHGDPGATAGGNNPNEHQHDNLDSEAFKAMKQELRERKRALSLLPRFNLNSTHGEEASVFLTPYANRTPVLFSDIQHLVTYAYGGNDLVPAPSRWCKLDKPNKLVQVVVLFVQGVGLNEFVDNEECFSRTMRIFGCGGGGATDEQDGRKNRGIVEFLDPTWYGDSVEGEVARWGVISGDRGRSENPNGRGVLSDKTVKNSNEANPDEGEQGLMNASGANFDFDKVVNQLGSVFPITTRKKKVNLRKPEEEDSKSDDDTPSLPRSDVFPRTQLILTLPQLIQEAYPLPIPANTMTRELGTVFRPTSSSSYSPVNSRSRMFSFDCEMCATELDMNALVRVGVVNEDLEVVYSSLVRPEGKITDYRTRWSGVSAEMLEGVEVGLADVQDKIIGIVNENPDCIFVGQSLNCDLKAIRMTHPYVIDTSVVFNLTGVQGRKSSLKDLALNLIDEKIQENKQHRLSNSKLVGPAGSSMSSNSSIQNNSNRGSRDKVGHDPVEDAAAAMKLVKAKLKSGYNFGNALKGASMFRGQNIVVSYEPALTRVTSSSNNKLDKNVLVIVQRNDDTSAPPASSPFLNPAGLPETASNSTPTIRPGTTKLVTMKECVTNGSVVKLIRTHVFESFMTMGFYKVELLGKEEGDDDEGGSCAKTLGKLDRRISKVYNDMCPNSLFVVVCSGGERRTKASDDGQVGGDNDDVKVEGDHSGSEGRGKSTTTGSKRRNNGVCFIRLRTQEPVRGRNTRLDD